MITFKCPSCGIVHNNGPLVPPDIYECEKCGRFRLRTDMPVVGGPPTGGVSIPQITSFTNEEIPGLIRSLENDQDMDLKGLRLIESLKELHLLRAQDEVGVKLTAGLEVVVKQFLEKNSLVHMGPGTGIPAEPTPEAEVEGEGWAKLYTAELSVEQILEFIRPILLDANLTGRHSARKAVLISFASTMMDRSSHHSQSMLVVSDAESQTHAGAAAAYEAAARMAKHFAEEGAQEKPALDS